LKAAQEETAAIRFSNELVKIHMHNQLEKIQVLTSEGNESKKAASRSNKTKY